MIGFIVNEVTNNSQNYLMFRSLNELAKTYDCYLFTDKVSSLPMKNNFAIMQQVESMSHRGILLSTSMITTQILNKNLTASRKYFYPQEIEWTHMQRFNAIQLKNIFYNKDIDLIAKSKSYSDLFTKLFKSPVGTIYNWNSYGIEEVLKL